MLMYTFKSSGVGLVLDLYEQSRGLLASIRMISSAVTRYSVTDFTNSVNISLYRKLAITVFSSEATVLLTISVLYTTEWGRKCGVYQ